jgi:tRNA G18 (ribose-2'-O)-methylase SpoU
LPVHDPHPLIGPTRPLVVGDPDLAVFTDLTDVALRTVREPADGVFIAEGLKVITRAMAAGMRPLHALTTQRWVDGLLGATGTIPVIVGTEDELLAVTGYRVHRGALVAFERPVDPGLAAIARDATRLVLLEDLKEHANVGTIVRSAAAFGLHGLVVSPKCADPLYRRSVKVAMGTVFTMPWTRSDEWGQTLRQVKALGFRLAALTPAQDATDLRTFTPRGDERIAMIFGTEGPGVSASTLAACDLRLRIPMREGVDSLNVGAAAAVAAYALAPT